jgi:sugar lactone lactonase YvrE
VNIRSSAAVVRAAAGVVASACVVALGVTQALAQATFYSPSGVAVQVTFNLYVADYDAVRKIAGGNVTTLAGPDDLTPPLHTCAVGYVNGTGSAARFNYISAIVVGPQTGNVYVTEHTNNTVRKITPSGVVTTLAGQGPTMSAPNPSLDGIGIAASFFHPNGIAIDNAETYLYVADSYDYSIRRVTIATKKVETVTAHGGLSNPDGIAIDPVNNNLLYIVEQGWGRVRKLDMSLYAGTPLAAASLPIIPPPTFVFNQPVGIALNNAGTLFVTEGNGGGNNVNEIKAGTLSGAKPVIAGAGPAGLVDAPAGPGTSAKFNTPAGIALDPSASSLFVADQRNNVVRRVGTGSPYGVTTYAGHAPGHPSGCKNGAI